MPAGKPFKVIKFAADITAVEEERRHAEEERTAKSEQQAHVVDSLWKRAETAVRWHSDIPHRRSLSAGVRTTPLRFQCGNGQVARNTQGVNANADAVRSGASELAGASDDLSRRTEQQAASLEETAAALNEITTTVANTAEGAKQANTTVAPARTEAEHSGEIVRQP